MHVFGLAAPLFTMRIFRLLADFLMTAREHGIPALKRAVFLDADPRAKGLASAWQRLLEQVKNQNPDRALVTNLVLEKSVNTFFRLRNPTVIRRLQETFPDLPENPAPKTVFIKLRELRNSW